LIPPRSSPFLASSPVHIQPTLFLGYRTPIFQMLSSISSSVISTAIYATAVLEDAKRKNRLDVDGEGFGGFQGLGEIRGHLVVAVEPGFGAGARARGFYFEQFLGQLRDRRRDAGVIDRILTG